LTENKIMKLVGLNLGIAAANIVTFSPGLIGIQLGGASVLATAFGSTFLFLSVAVFGYGNYKMLVGQEKVIRPNEINTREDYLEALKTHKGKKTFEKTVVLLLDQIERITKKKETITGILLQIFNDTELSYKKFDTVITEVEKIFYMNIRSILNKLNAFDEEDYDYIRKKNAAGTFSQEFMADKLKVYNEYIAFVKAAAEENEQILLKLDKLLLEISGLNSIESGQIEQMAGMIEIDNLIKQAKYYK
jgi:hypothetical protein